MFNVLLQCAHKHTHLEWVIFRLVSCSVLFPLHLILWDAIPLERSTSMKFFKCSLFVCCAQRINMNYSILNSIEEDGSLNKWSTVFCTLSLPLLLRLPHCAITVGCRRANASHGSDYFRLFVSLITFKWKRFKHHWR